MLQIFSAILLIFENTISSVRLRTIAGQPIKKCPFYFVILWQKGRKNYDFLWKYTLFFFWNFMAVFMKFCDTHWQSKAKYRDVQNWRLYNYKTANRRLKIANVGIGLPGLKVWCSPGTSKTTLILAFFRWSHSHSKLDLKSFVFIDVSLVMTTNIIKVRATIKNYDWSYVASIWIVRFL